MFWLPFPILDRRSIGYESTQFMTRSKNYNSFVCGCLGRNLSIAALVSSLLRCLNSVTQSVTVDTISRAARRAVFPFTFLTTIGLISSFLTTFIFNLPSITMLLHFSRSF